MNICGPISYCAMMLLPGVLKTEKGVKLLLLAVKLVMFSLSPFYVHMHRITLSTCDVSGRRTSDHSLQLWRGQN